MKHKRSLISITLATIMLISLCAVCANTSVSAAQGSSRASVKASPSLVGSPIAAGTGPAACVLQGSDSMYVFVKGYDGALWYRIWSLTTHGWSGGWTSLGGKLTSSPSAVSRSSGVMDVFVRGTNGNVYDRWFVGGAWYDWLNIGGQVAPGTGPGASGWGGRMDVFVEGTNGALYQKTWSSGWSGWASLGGKLTSSPAAVSTNSDVIDVFVRGTNGAVYQKLYDGAWYNWYKVGGQVAPGTGPAVCSYSFGRMDVFVEGTNGALYQNTCSNGFWYSWASLGGKLMSSPTAATFTHIYAMDIEVFVRGSGAGLIYLKEYWDGSWDTGWLGPYQGPP